MPTSPGADDIVGLYGRHAKAFARKRGTALVERAWLDRFCALLPQRAAVLDIGCGSGRPIAGYLAQRSCEVVGVDSAPEMIALFARNFPGVASHVADMRQLSLGRRFDGLLAWDSLFHLTPADQRLCFPIFRRHAAARAALMFTSGPSHGEAIGALEGEPLYHASLDGAEYRLLLDQQGFDVVAHAVEDPACGRHTIWLARLR